MTKPKKPDGWVRTGEANRILGVGITEKTFRDKFRDILPWHWTKGGRMEWLKEAVEALALKD